MIHFKQLGDGPCKTYLLASSKTREAVLVDPLLEKAESYLSALRGEGWKLACVIDTHTHADHLSAGTVLGEKASVPYAMHENTRTATASRRLKDGEVLAMGDLKISVLHTPGHTTDSLSLMADGRLLSGDFLFNGQDGAGRLDLPGSDPAAHFKSLRRLDALEGGTQVLPAHVYSGPASSTLGAERRSNPVLSPRGQDEYLRWWSERKLGPADWMRDVVKANLAGARDPRAVVIPKEGAACACALPSGAGELPRISPADLARKLAAAPGSVVLLDVRTQEEFTGELGHIAGSVLIPIDELAARISEVPPGPVAAVCRSGGRASKAAALLRASGRSEVWVMTGGMLAWNEARLPLA